MLGPTVERTDSQCIAGEYTHVAESVGLGRRVYTDEDEIRFLNGCFDIGGKEQVSISDFLHHFIESRLERGMNDPFSCRRPRLLRTAADDPNSTRQCGLH